VIRNKAYNFFLITFGMKNIGRKTISSMCIAHWWSFPVNIFHSKGDEEKNYKLHFLDIIGLCTSDQKWNSSLPFLILTVWMLTFTELPRGVCVLVLLWQMRRDVIIQKYTHCWLSSPMNRSTVYCEYISIAEILYWITWRIIHNGITISHTIFTCRHSEQMKMTNVYQSHINPFMFRHAAHSCHGLMSIDGIVDLKNIFD
jgi:hypothetical protein